MSGRAHGSPNPVRDTTEKTGGTVVRCLSQPDNDNLPSVPAMPGIGRKRTSGGQISHAAPSGPSPFHRCKPFLPLPRESSRRCLNGVNLHAINLAQSYTPPPRERLAAASLCLSSGNQRTPEIVGKGRTPRACCNQSRCKCAQCVRGIRLQPRCHHRSPTLLMCVDVL